MENTFTKEIDQATGLPLANPNANFNTGQIQTPPPVPTVQPAQPTAQPTAPAQTYTIQQGDTLSQLARQYGTTVGALVSLNPNITDPDKIYQGQEIKVAQQMAQQPAPAKSETAPKATEPTTEPTETYQTPTVKDTMKLYEEAYKQTGASENLKQKNKYLDEAKIVTDEMNDKIEALNNDPWLSSSSRAEQVEKLKDKYALRLNTLSNFAKLFEAQYETDVATAKFLATGMQEDQQFAMNMAMKKQEAIEALNEKDMQIVQSDGGIYSIDKKTGKITTLKSPIPGTGTGEGVISPYQDERMYRNIQSVDELSILARQNPAIFGRSAAAPIPNWLRTDDFRNFEAQLDTLKANITYGELTAMREASKTGGALGQISDREGQLLGAALGALSMSQSPENFVLQLAKIKESILRWRAAMTGSGTSDVTVTAPTGEQVIITD